MYSAKQNLVSIFCAHGTKLRYILFQALPQVTVVVGKKSEGNLCRVLTLAESVDEPKYVEFPVPSAETPQKPGSPKWANYVKGVVANYIGMV